jgi:hypothetical protein
MRNILHILALLFSLNVCAQTTAVQVQHGKYINKEWKYNKPIITNMNVLFDYPCVSVGDSTYQLTSNIGDTTTSMYSLYVSHCLNNKNVVGVLAISIYTDGSYYLSVTYGNLIRRYTLKNNDYEMGNNRQ